MKEVFRALLLSYDATVGALFVLMGIGITGTIWDDPALANECSLLQLGTGLVLLAAGVLLFAVRAPKCWNVGAISHGVTVVCLGVSSWSMWKVATIAATRPPGYEPVFAPGEAEALWFTFFSVWPLCPSLPHSFCSS